MIPKNENGTVIVETYGVAEFLKELEPLLKDGYSLGFTENDHYPQSYGAFYSCVVVKDKDRGEVKGVEEVKEKKAGRPAKVS